LKGGRGDGCKNLEKYTIKKGGRKTRKEIKREIVNLDEKNLGAEDHRKPKNDEHPGREKENYTKSSFCLWGQGTLEKWGILGKEKEG